MSDEVEVMEMASGLLRTCTNGYILEIQQKCLEVKSSWISLFKSSSITSYGGTGVAPLPSIERRANPAVIPLVLFLISLSHLFTIPSSRSLLFHRRPSPAGLSLFSLPPFLFPLSPSHPLTHTHSPPSVALSLTPPLFPPLSPPRSLPLSPSLARSLP
eukprot:3506587-Pleurochrysis_carterae.AAC.1